MTQDQYGQTRGPGYVVRDDAVPNDENEEYASGESKSMTRFQKVASALRGGGPERDEEDQAAQAADPQAPQAPQAQRKGDYWDEPAASTADRDEAVAVTTSDAPVPATGDVPVPATGTDRTGTDPLARQDQATGQASPDAADHLATQPDMFGTTAHAGNGATSAPYPEDQVGEATNGAPANGAPAGGTSAGGVPAGDVTTGEVTGTTGRHAAGTSVGTSVATESRPGEAAGTLGDFSDLTYGNLIPDATVYLEQWQQVQFKFVDDPHASVTEAADIVAQVTAKLEAAIQERQRAIEERQRAIAEQQRSLRDRWGEGTNADTEGLRETLRMYRTFIDQLIGTRAG